jgi:hypothetical protein
VVGGSGSRSSGPGWIADILRRGNRADGGGIVTRTRLRDAATPSPRRTTPMPPRNTSSRRLGARDRAPLATGATGTARTAGRRCSIDPVRAPARTGLATGSRAGTGGTAFRLRRGIEGRGLPTRPISSARALTGAEVCTGETAAKGCARAPARPRVTRRARPADRRGCAAGGAARTGCASEGTGVAGCSAGRG